MAPLLTDSKPLLVSSIDSWEILSIADRTNSYWDFPYQSSNYSFVDFAVAKGYSILYYDRVGAGESFNGISGYVSQ